MLREIHRYTWLSSWFMGRELKKGQGRQTDGQNSVDFNIDLHMPFNVENMFAIIKETASSNRQILCLIDSSA